MDDQMMTMDTVFPSIGTVGDRGVYREEDSDYENELRELITDAEDFEEMELRPKREEYQKYFNGDLPAKPVTEDDEEVQKSKFVSTDVRDTIMTIMPSLIRIFMGAENVVNIIPNNEDQVDAAEAATKYVNYVFWEDNEGFLLLHNVFKDALTVRSGILEWSTDLEQEVSETSFSNIDEEQLMLLLSERPDVEVVELENSDTMPGIYEFVKLRYLVSKPVQVIEGVPPEEFLISSNASSINDARLVGRKRIVTKSSLIKRGVPEELLEDREMSDSEFTEERYLRNPGFANAGSIHNGVLFKSMFVRIDADGDGIDELRYIETVGVDNYIIKDEVVDYVRMALFCPDPVPHTAIGEALTGLIKDIQQIKSSMLRSALDNLANSVVPRTAYNMLLVDSDDMLNDDQSGIIRTRGNPNELIKDMVTPFVGQQVFSMVDQMDKVRASRTGITEASKGLDPGAMQSTNLTGINAIISGAQERIELIARILAETGFKDLFRGIFREVVRHPNPDRTVQVAGKFVTFRPSTYDPNMQVKVNPTLGKGSDTTRLMALQEIKATQTAVMTQFGVDNPLCGPIEFRNTLEDIMAIANVKATTRYFRVITPEQQEAIANQPKEPDAATLLAMAEYESVKADTAKAVSERNIEYEKMLVKDDFDRDKLMIDTAVDVMGIFAKFPAAPEPTAQLSELNTNDQVPVR